MQFKKEQIGDGDMVLHYGAILLFTEATGFPKLNSGCVMLFVHIHTMLFTQSANIPEDYYINI